MLPMQFIKRSILVPMQFMKRSILLPMQFMEADTERHVPRTWARLMRSTMEPRSFPRMSFLSMRKRPHKSSKESSSLRSGGMDASSNPSVTCTELFSEYESVILTILIRCLGNLYRRYTAASRMPIAPSDGRKDLDSETTSMSEYTALRVTRLHLMFSSPAS